MAIDFGGFPVLAEDGLVPCQQPKGFFLFGVDTEDGVVPHVPEQGYQEAENPELLFAVRALSDEQLFGRLPLAVALFLKHPANETVGDLQLVLRKQMAPDVTKAQVRPLDFFIRRAASCVFFHEGQNQLLQVRVGDFFFSTPAKLSLPGAIRFEVSRHEFFHAVNYNLA